MPFVTHEGVATWYEVEGSGPPLVLHIGFLGSLEDWRREDTRYTEALRDTYQLILLDPRGQGRSDAPHDPELYSLRARAGDVLAVLNDCDIERAHYWGYSLGGIVGFVLAMNAPDRLHSLIVGGASPFSTVGEDPTDQVIYRWLEDGIEGFVAQWERHIGPLPDPPRTQWLANDAEALRAAFLAPDWHGPGETRWISDALPNVDIPALLYAGSEDEPALVERAARAMPNATFVELSGMNHPTAFRRSDLILPHVRRFLDRVVGAPAAMPGKAESA